MTGQMSIFDFLEPPKEDPTKLPCDDCKHDIDGCCDYDEPLGDYCVMGNARDTTLNRKGEVEDAPDWYSKERCEKCQHWEFSPNQPPAGWGVKGFCTSHRGQGREVGSTSYCQDFKRRSTAECNGCKYMVWLHKGGRGERSCDRYDGCKYTPREEIYEI